MYTHFRYCLIFIAYLALPASWLYAQDVKAPEPPKVPRPCYESLLKLDPVKEDSTESKIPYQVYLFRYQREYMVVVADTSNYYSFNYKRVRQNGVKVDSLSANSLAFDLSICKLFDVKELTLKEKKRKVGDLDASHFYTFSRKQQRLYASMRAVETGKARTFIGKSLAELKEIPKIFAFLKAKPNEKLQAQMQAMKDQAKKMKDEMKKVKDQAAKVEETMAKLQEQKKKIDEELAKLKKEKEEKQAKEAPKETPKDSTKNNAVANNTKNPQDNKNPKDSKNPKDNKNPNQVTTKNPITDTVKLSKKEAIIKDMDKMLREIELLGNINDLQAKKQQLINQKEELKTTKEGSTEIVDIKIDSEKQKAEMLAKIHEIDDILKELKDDNGNDIRPYKGVLNDKRALLKKKIKEIEEEKTKENNKPQ